MVEDEAEALDRMVKDGDNTVDDGSSHSDEEDSDKADSNSDEANSSVAAEDLYIILSRGFLEMV